MNAETKDAQSVIELPAESFSRREDRELPALVPAGNVTPLQLLNMAVSQGADLAKLEKLLDLQQRWERDEARKAFNTAFAAFKAQAVTIIKNRMVDAGPLAGKRYAELFAVVNALTPALSANGLSASWKLTKDEKDWIEVTCFLTHTLGHSESVSMGGPPDTGGAKSPIQARASTVSYLERYTLKAVCGVSEQDDDQDAGTGPKRPEPDAEGKKILEACGSLSALKKAWSELTAEQRKTLSPVMDDCRKRIAEADRAAA